MEAMAWFSELPLLLLLHALLLLLLVWKMLENNCVVIFKHGGSPLHPSSVPEAQGRVVATVATSSGCSETLSL